MKKYLLLIFIFIPSYIFCQSSKISLQKQIETLLSGFHGTVGVYVKNLKTGETASVNADTLFPTASMIKVPILIGVMDKIENGELEYHQQMLFDEKIKRADDGEDLLASFSNNQKITLSKLMMLMLTTSDNTASKWLQQLSGTGSRINEIMSAHGFMYTRVNSNTVGRTEEYKKFGWGVTTPKEMVRIFEMLYKGEVINPIASARMIRMLGRNYWDEECMGQIPVDVFIADKVGAINASRSETLLVTAPHGTYIFSIITKNQEDTSWNSDNEGWVLERKVSHFLWNYFEPKSNWKPIIDYNGNWVKEKK